MKVLVTGASGFIGKEIIKELSENKIEFVGLGNRKTGSESNLKNEFYFADISRYENIAELEELEKIDAVIHSAGLAHQFGDTKREAFEAVNINGTENISKLAVKLKAKHFILISSTAVYGLKKEKINEDTICEPETIYAESKLKAEEVCRRICEKSSIDLTILRLSPVIGEGSSGNAERLINAIDKKRFLWIGKGKNLKTLIYKKDVTRAVVMILKEKKSGMEIFNLAAAPILMKEFVGEIERNLNRKTPPVFIPPIFLQSVFFINSKTTRLKKISKIADTVEKWLSDDVYSAERIREKYNFEARTSAAEAIGRQVKFYISRRGKN